MTARQERLLQGLMREIVRMTAQKQPLEVGVPLYPFSHTTLFRKDLGARPQSEQGSSGSAPLPVSPVYEQQSLPGRVPSTHPVSPNGSILGQTWPRRDASGSPATNSYGL